MRLWQSSQSPLTEETLRNLAELLRRPWTPPPIPVSAATYRWYWDHYTVLGYRPHSGRFCSLARLRFAKEFYALAIA